MSQMDQIKASLRRTTLRRQWIRAWLGLWKGLMWGGLLYLAALAAYKVFPLPLEAAYIAGAVGLALPFGWAVVNFFRKPTLMDTARWVDESHRFDERLSTALELESKPDNAWSQMVIRDAHRFLNQIQPRQLVPVRVPSLGRWVVLVLAVGAGLGFVPEYRSDRYVEEQRQKASIQEAGEELEAYAKRLRERQPPRFEPTEELLDEFQDLGERLNKAKLTRADALKEISNVAEKLRKETAKFEENPAIQKLRQEARERSGASSEANALSKRIEDLQKQLGEQAGQSEAMQELKKKLDNLMAAATSMQNSDSAATDEQRAQMAEALSEMMQQAQAMGLDLDSLENALSAMQASKMDQMVKELEAATRDLEKTLEMAKTLERMRAKNGEAGKNLAEQLDRGQVEAALSNLLNKIQKLNNPQLSQAKMSEMLKEISDALDPAEAYGEVAEHLKDATRQMGQNQKQLAAESLQKAADALEELLKQMSDCEGLMGQLDALQKAQMCVGNCMSWGQCKSRIPKAGKGGGASAGVGTWGDDSQWFDYSQMETQTWDNSGVERPDMEGKELAERPTGLPSGMIPDRLRGKISPGGPMPSITLKGLSVKGESNVSFEEAVTAAQSEAQSALNQDKIPRAYRGAVRNYFDEMDQ